MKTCFFTPQNLGGECLALAEDIRLGTPTAVFGVSDPHKYLLVSSLGENILYIAPDHVTASAAYEAISVLSGRRCALLTAKDEVYTYKDALSKDALYKRICAVYEILHGAPITVCDVEAITQLFPASVPSLTLERGKEADFSALAEQLVNMGYTREYSVDSKGSFAIRGDILDVFPINCENPVRVDFFGDEVEKIKPYDVASGERLGEEDELTVIAASDAFFRADDLPVVEKALRESLKTCPDSKAYARSKEIADDVLEKMRLGAPFAGASFVMPLLGSCRTIFDLLDKNAVVVFDECKLIEDRLNALEKENAERFSGLKLGGEAFTFTKMQTLSAARLYDGFKNYRSVAVQTFTSSTRFFTPLKTYNMHSTPSPDYLNALPRFVEDCKSWLSNGYRVLAFAGGTSRYDKLISALAEAGVPAYSAPDRAEALKGTSVSAESLAHGLILHEVKLVVVGSGDLYTKNEVKRIRRRRGDMFVSPEIGDYAVHEKHGVGRITGTRKIQTTEGIKEYIAVEYRGGDMLYVPVEQMDVLSKYVGESDPALSKIGGAEFERVKERARQSIKKLAFDLKKLYAERAEKRGFRFPENAVMMQEFEDAFEYEETPDQLSSIQEIKADMCSDKVMDRLLCGDVGYGKTEVALRAVYLCVLGGKQAAIMCPSTILSEQHYNTACERFREFGLRVGKLNRFKTPKQQEETLKDLKNGDIDLIIGTHRLLSDDVKFYDLGLLVLDEEQRFGVEHKEKIKRMKSDVDCLTMTATPIPRTLHMSLAGIRDISTINTPPQKRLPVQTYVVEETETLIRDACIRELSRGGQVFILYNRVESIATFTARIEQILPEGKICYAHGRMDRDTLENNVFSFYRGEKNILVTTTIIENGVDLPNANTIIVIDADRLGISQLYQLRGRVGRGARLAQAYFTFKPSKVLTSDAAERLKAIMRFTELGSGFKIAMRDLEIRGAGNVLGAEQHGHMDKVGYELYSKLLKEELTGETQFSPELDVKASAYIPEDYVESSAGRLDCYKQIAEIKTIDDYNRVRESIKDNYGRMPQPVVNLLVIAVLKSYASQFNVRSITVAPDGAALELPDVNALKGEGLNAALKEYSSVTKLSMTKKPQIIFSAAENQARTMALMTNFLKFALSFA